ncbi:MAG: hypothetical protein QOJ65_1198 [Fimbriimonadaceae bacterium]|jgi:hypothetical protein|nr:hypothetical protein [Fimbriimonadaceae bacterium]
MDDIRRQDLKVFLREFLAVPRVLIVLCLIVLVGAVLRLDEAGAVGFARAIPIWAIILATAAMTAYNSSRELRFLNRRYKALWDGCQDRLARFNEVLKRLRKEQIADLHEMPNTIRRVAEALYIALRRADMISSEVLKTERNLYAAPPAWSAAPTDPQSKELYRIADKNIAEYRHHYAGVMAGVERAEAQSAVFMTTLDTLRMRLLGYRLIGKSPEMPSRDFLEALAEAKLQLQAIDTALEELDLGQYPTMIAVIPPAPPDHVRETLAMAFPETMEREEIERTVEGG